MDVAVLGARGVPSSYSGYETFLTAFLPELVARGHRVTVYGRAGHTPSPWHRGVRCEVVPTLDTKELGTITQGFTSAARIVRARHDVVLAVNVVNATVSAALSRLGRVPVVLNTDGVEWERGKWGPVARSVFRLNARISRRAANALVADCNAMAAIYESSFSARSTVIPYCWPELDVDPAGACLADLGLEPDGYALVAGRLNPENQGQAIVEAFVRSDLDLPLLVLGAANYDSPVAAAIAGAAAADGRIRFLGHVDDRRTYATLVSKAAAYVHGHTVGGMNPSLVEAMGGGAMVVAADTAFNREVLADAGVYFADPQVDLVPQLRRIRTPGGADVARHRVAAARRAHERYGLEAVTDAYEALLLEACRRGPGDRPVTVPTRWTT